MEVKPNTLSYRGKTFSDVEEYARYILRCAEDDRVKAEKDRQKKLEFEKEQRIQELNSAYKNYLETCKTAREKYDALYKKFMNDYSSNSLSKVDACNVAFLNKIVKEMLK